MSGDVTLTLTIIGLDIALLFTLFKREAVVSPVTAAIYTLLVGVGAIGFMQNSQAGPFAAQALGALEWLLMLRRSLRIGERS